MDRPQAERLLRTAVGRPDARFRPGQWEAIGTLANERSRLLLVERTGWGKSSVYFVSTRILRNRGFGPALIVSPLLALMRNQIDAAKRLGIRAETVNSTNQEEWETVRAQMLANEVDVLLISPERLANEAFMNRFLMPVAGSIGLLVIDEVHCVSDWGHDFRPDYQRIVNVLRQLPRNVPVLGTTATANDRVIDDVRKQFGSVRVQRGPLVRESLALQTLRLPDQAARLAWLAQRIPELPGTGIVYVLTIRDAVRVASWLAANGIDARAYHSGVEGDGFANANAYRQHLEDQLLGNRIKVLVATTALGMGYDKPDLGFVIHYQVPGSVVAYYQQVGRAGRAIDRAHGVLLSGTEDSAIVAHFRDTAFPPETDVAEILAALDDSDGLSLRELETRVNLRRGRVEKALKFLAVERPSPVLKSGSRWHRSPVPYAMDRERIRRLTEQREREWAEIQDYVGTDECLMAFLQRALNDPQAEDCGRCANCLGKPVLESSFAPATAASAARFLRRSEEPFLPKKQVAKDAFPSYGFQGNIPPGLRTCEGRILSRWGDAGWGAIVVEDKRNGHFRDELVAAAAAMIRERWKPSPRPAWVTCVPSRRRPELVRSLAKRLAARLRLPFRPVVRVLKDNQPQKEQHNRFHQCRNLDGAFGVSGDVAKAPVLLVDDVTDSGWTLAVVGALLLQAGSGPVFPVTLASTAATAS